MNEELENAYKILEDLKKDGEFKFHNEFQEVLQIIKLVDTTSVYYKRLTDLFDIHLNIIPK